jgi:hypothetical protein
MTSVLSLLAAVQVTAIQALLAILFLIGSSHLFKVRCPSFLYLGKKFHLPTLLISYSCRFVTCFLNGSAYLIDLTTVS